MAIEHRLVKAISSTGLTERKRQWEQQTGEPYPHPTEQAWSYEVRDVTAGVTVASGFASTYADADEQATSALEEAEAAEAERFAAEG